MDPLIIKGLYHGARGTSFGAAFVSLKALLAHGLTKIPSEGLIGLEDLKRSILNGKIAGEQINDGLVTQIN
jgi:hypothetical protein